MNGLFIYYLAVTGGGSHQEAIQDLNNVTSFYSLVELHIKVLIFLEFGQNNARVVQNLANGHADQFLYDSGP